jgi:hypothetical protein
MGMYHNSSMTCIEVYSIQHYVIKVCQLLAKGQWFSPGTPVSSTNKTDRHDITEILLKVFRFKKPTQIVKAEVSLFNSLYLFGQSSNNSGSQDIAEKVL